MRAVVLEGGFGLENLHCVERPVPEPGPNDVVLRMRAASINYRDQEIVSGSYFMPCPLPLIPLSDGVGEVVELGAGVRSVARGDRVAATYWDDWSAGDCEAADFMTTLGGPLDGMLAEYVCLPERRVIRVPQHLSDTEAAALPCAGVTAWHALIGLGGVAPGHSVLVQGTGGVACFAAQFALLAGASVFVISASDEKLARVRALGNAGNLHAVNRLRTPDWHLAVRELTGGRGVDHVVDVAGPRSFAQSLSVLRPGGRVYVIGYLGGPEGAVSPLQILMARASVHAVTVGPRAAFEAMNRALEVAHLHPLIDRVFPFEQLAEGLRYVRAARHVGKVVLRFGG
jgi:NADPH:quinone reductase-like Zn-dependent oxidoreductase